MTRQFEQNREQWHFALSINGRNAGQQLWELERIPQEGGTLFRAEVQTNFRGALPTHSVFQTSESWLSHTGQFGTRHYTEYCREIQDSRSPFESRADPKEGVLYVKNGDDSIDIPLLQDYQDPLSLNLLILLQAGQKVIQARMLSTRVFANLISHDNGFFLYRIIPGKPQVAIKDNQLYSFTQPSDYGLIYGERLMNSRSKISR